MHARRLFLTSLGAGSPGQGTSSSGSGRDLPVVFSLCPHVEEGARPFWSVFYKGTDPIHKGSTQSLPSTMTSGVRLQHMDLGGQKPPFCNIPPVPPQFLSSHAKYIPFTPTTLQGLKSHRNPVGETPGTLVPRQSPL